MIVTHYCNITPLTPNHHLTDMNIITLLKLDLHITTISDATKSQYWQAYYITILLTYRHITAIVSHYWHQIIILLTQHLITDTKSSKTSSHNITAFLSLCYSSDIITSPPWHHNPLWDDISTSPPSLQLSACANQDSITHIFISFSLKTCQTD